MFAREFLVVGYDSQVHEHILLTLGLQSSKKIEDIPNITNRSLLIDFHKYLNSNGVSERHQNNNLKAQTAFAHFLGPTTSFLDIKENDLIISF